jgi:crescentin
MSTISEILSLARLNAKAGASDPLTTIQPADHPLDYSDSASSQASTARLGRDGEALRNLLSDTSHELRVVDDLAANFHNLTATLSGVITDLEQEKAESARTKGALAALRSAHDAMRRDYRPLEERHSSLQAESERLNQELGTVRTRISALEAERSQLNTDIASERSAILTIQTQLDEQTSSARALAEENKDLADRADASEKKAAVSEVEVISARQNLSALESEKALLATSLDQALADSSQLTHQLAESEKLLSNARSSLAQVKRRLGAAEARRIKIAAACEMANERRQNETQSLSSKVQALQLQSDNIDKQLAETRQSLVARSQEIRTVESKLSEAHAARSKAEKKLEKQAAAAESWAHQVEKLEQINSKLTEKCRVTTETLSTSEGWLLGTKEKIASLTDELKRVQEDTVASDTKFNEDAVQLAATLEHERCQRALAEGALETVRRDYARLQEQIAKERALRRGSRP